MGLQNIIRRAIEIGHRSGFITFDQQNELILLRHEFSSSPCCGYGPTARTSRQGFDDPPD